MGGNARTDELIGRERELAALDRALAQAPDGGTVLVLTGDAGIGKTALAGAARERAAARGMTVLHATGVQSEADLPYSGLHQLLLPCLDGVDQLPPPQRGALLAALGLGDDARRPDPYLTGLAVLGLLGDAAERAPLLVVAEDAHWLDRPTCDALAFVGRRLEADAIVLLLTARGRAPRAIRAAGFPALELGPLDADAAAQVLAARAPHLDPAARRAVLGQADGNPLALVELAADPRRGDDLGDAGMTVPLTARLERAFTARASELPPATRAVLLVAALAQRGDLTELLTAATLVAGGEEIAVGDLDPAVAAGLVEVEGGALRFRHPLVRSALAQAAPVERRHTAHAALAAVLAADPDRAVWHRVASTVGTDEALAASLVATAARAGRVGSVVTAVTALERAAGFTAEPQRKAARLLDAAELALDIGRADLVTRLVDAAGALDAPGEQDRVAWLRAQTSGSPVDPAVVAGLFDHAERLLLAGDLARATEAAVTAAFRCWWNRPGPELIARAEAVADGLAAAGGEGGARRRLVILALVDPIPHGREIVAGLAEVDPDAVHPEELRLLALAGAIVGAFERSAALAEAAVTRLRARGRYGTLAPALVTQAWSGVFLGDWATARAAAEESVRVGLETGQPLWAVSGNAAAAALAGMRGETEAARAFADAAEALLPPGLADGMQALVAFARGLTELFAGDPAAGHAHLRRLVDPADPAATLWVAAWAVGILAVTAQEEDAPAARAAVEELARVADASGFPFLVADVAFARAVLSGDEEAAEARFAGALHAAADLPLLRARVQLAHGGWLRRRRRAGDARAVLRAARDAFDALGARPLRDVARAELRAAGEVTATADADHARELLSPHELLIARMAADGLSNREIGAALYLSHRTIGSHLYRIFPKLGIASRAELRGVLQAA